MNPARKEDFHFPEVRVVEASAGSGKTYALAKRYIQLLLHPKNQTESMAIRSILAITFTNKSAFEMKARILDFLKTIAIGPIPENISKNILEPIGLDEKQARSKALVAMESIIRHYNFFQVQTIDKFVNALLAGCAFKIGLTANFKIKTNTTDYLQYSLDDLIDQAATNKSLRAVFEEFLHHYLYLENRSGWFPKDDILSIVKNLHYQFNAYGRNFKTSPVAPIEIIKHKKKILSDIHKLSETLPEGTDARFVKSLSAFIEKNKNAFDIDGISNYFFREDPPLKMDAKAPKEFERLWRKIHANFKELCEQEAFGLFDPYVVIFQLVKDNFYKFAAKDDVLFLEELNKKAGLLFDEDYVTVEELYYRLATRFRHYLIDEFQDTSRLQWRNLEKMAEEALSTGGSLFYVGDRKQAIYGFRGGEVDLFNDVKNQFSAFNINVEMLTNNWRSHKAIVEFNNQIFSHENLRTFIQRKQEFESEKKKNSRNLVVFQENDLKNMDEIFANVQQTYQPKNNQGYVHIQFMDADKKEERDEHTRVQLIETLGRLKGNYTWSDIAILTRSNREIEQITNWLMEEGIVVESERTSNIKENRLIGQLVSFLRFLNSPIDNLAFTEFILSDLFTKVAGVDAQSMHDFVFSLRAQIMEKKDFYVYRAFREKYPQLWEKLIEEFFKNVGLYPLYELVISIFHRWDILEKFPLQQGFLMHFLEMIKNKEQDHTDVASFLDYFEDVTTEEVYVRLSGQDAVKILTIHKSKGLEFPVVICPFLGMDIQVGSTNQDNQQSYILQPCDEEFQLLRLKEKYYGFSDELYQIYAREYKKALLSELNNVYVALTRAKNELYAFIPKKIAQSINPMQFLIPQELYECGQPMQKRDEEKVDAELLVQRLANPQYHDWMAYLREEYLAFEELKKRDERFKGEVIHFLLSHIHALTDQTKEALIASAAQLTQAQFPQLKDVQLYVDIARRLVERHELKPFFYLSEGVVFTEKEIVDSFGQTKRIDRLMVDHQQVMVIDYKSSKIESENHYQQVQAYMELLGGIYPDKKIKGYLVYLDVVAIEEVHWTKTALSTSLKAA